MTTVEEQNLAIAHIFVEQFLGNGDMSVAADVLDENIQAITRLKPDGPINGRADYQQVFSAFFDAFPSVLGHEMTIEDIFATGDRVVVRFINPAAFVPAYFGIAP